MNHNSMCTDMTETCRDAEEYKSRLIIDLDDVTVMYKDRGNQVKHLTFSMTVYACKSIQSWTKRAAHVVIGEDIRYPMSKMISN